MCGLCLVHESFTALLSFCCLIDILVVLLVGLE